MLSPAPSKEVNQNNTIMSHNADQAMTTACSVCVTSIADDAATCDFVKQLVTSSVFQYNKPRVARGALVHSSLYLTAGIPHLEFETIDCSYFLKLNISRQHITNYIHKVFKVESSYGAFSKHRFNILNFLPLCSNRHVYDHCCQTYRLEDAAHIHKKC